MRKTLMAAAICGAVSLTVVAEVNIPHDFEAGTPARASEVNENNQALKDYIEALEARLAKIEPYIDTVPPTISVSQIGLNEVEIEFSDDKELKGYSFTEEPSNYYPWGRSVINRDIFPEGLTKGMTSFSVIHTLYYWGDYTVTYHVSDNNNIVDSQPFSVSIPYPEYFYSDLNTVGESEISTNPINPVYAMEPPFELNLSCFYEGVSHLVTPNGAAIYALPQANPLDLSFMHVRATLIDSSGSGVIELMGNTSAETHPPTLTTSNVASAFMDRGEASISSVITATSKDEMSLEITFNCMDGTQINYVGTLSLISL